jgi:hypothetical protein
MRPNQRAAVPSSGDAIWPRDRGDADVRDDGRITLKLAGDAYAGVSVK